MTRQHPPANGAEEPKRLMIRLTVTDYQRLAMLAASDGVAVAVKARELMLVAMDPQIFGDRIHDVERLLRRVVRDEMTTHSERLHKRLYRVGGIAAAMVFFVRDVLVRFTELTPQDVAQLWREAEGHGFKYMGARQTPMSTADSAGEQ